MLYPLPYIMISANAAFPYIQRIKSRTTCPILTKQPQGTGSYPPCEKGLQRKILQRASNPPWNTPYFSTASIA
jgi:hypothetical protein